MLSYRRISPHFNLPIVVFYIIGQLKEVSNQAEGRKKNFGTADLDFSSITLVESIRRLLFLPEKLQSRSAGEV